MQSAEATVPTTECGLKIDDVKSALIEFTKGIGNDNINCFC